MAINNKLRKVLIDTAKKEGGTISYSEAGNIVELNMNSIADRTTLAHMLGEISWFEHENNRPLLSVVVVHGSDEITPMPGKGFFNLARESGKMKPDEDVLGFFIEELKRANNYWSKNDK
ncbi:MAG: hypothetical protein BWY02_02068 [bacterium ADurb.Bin157]|nr:MAG: hypothetical protein BWY02_02068 [bacterium ADurb.Bin157]